MSNQTLERVLALVKRYGREATSFQVLEPGLHYWFLGESACVAYAETRGAWVSAGEPLCASEDFGTVTQAFVAAADAAGKRARFFHVSEPFCAESRLKRTHIGEMPIWAPSQWAQTLAGSKGLREQLRRARAKGVSVRAVPAHELGDPTSPVRRDCEALVQRWLGSRGLSEMKFMVMVHPFSFSDERRYVVAEQGGALIGFAAAVPIYERAGWFLEDLIRDPSAPNGTAELLVDGMMKGFAEANVRYATLGLAPLAGDVSPVLAFTRKHTRRLYNFPGVRSFKEKLRPSEWVPVYLAYPRGELGLLAMTDVLSAFAETSFLGFALDSLVHQRTLATLTLAIALVPWTLALLFADTSIWFPSQALQYAWVGFDVLLVALMFSLVRKWRTWVAEALAVLTSIDALLTTLQVLLWNVWTAKSGLAWALVLLGSAGPLLASLFFRRARRLAMGGSIRAHA